MFSPLRLQSMIRACMRALYWLRRSRRKACCCPPVINSTQGRSLEFTSRTCMFVSSPEGRLQAEPCHQKCPVPKVCPEQVSSTALASYLFKESECFEASTASQPHNICLSSWTLPHVIPISSPGSQSVASTVLVHGDSNMELWRQNP